MNILAALAAALLAFILTGIAMCVGLAFAGISAGGPEHNKILNLILGTSLAAAWTAFVLVI